MTTEHWDFLKESETSLGLFYPLHYIVAGYGGMGAAQDAEEAFRAAGVGNDAVRAVSGTFVAGKLESRDDESLLKRAQTRFVEVLGTETGFLDQDRKHARAGGAFLFVYTPDEDSAAAAKEILRVHAPDFARRYMRPGIEIIVLKPDPD